MDIKKLNGWVMLPGDGKKDDPYRREYCSNLGRFQHWVLVRDGEITSYASTTDVVDKPRDGWRDGVMSQLAANEKVWGKTAKQLLEESKPDGWHVIPGDGCISGTNARSFVSQRYVWCAYYHRGIPTAVHNFDLSWTDAKCIELMNETTKGRDPINLEWVRSVEKEFGKTIQQIFNEAEKPTVALNGWHKAAQPMIELSPTTGKPYDAEKRLVDYWFFFENGKIIGATYNSFGAPIPSGYNLDKNFHTEALAVWEKAWGKPAASFMAPAPTAATPATEPKRFDVIDGWYHIPGDSAQADKTTGYKTRKTLNGSVGYFWAYIQEGKVVAAKYHRDSGPPDFAIVDAHKNDLSKYEALWNQKVDDLIRDYLPKFPEKKVPYADGWYLLAGDGAGQRTVSTHGTHYYYAHVKDGKILGARRSSTLYDSPTSTTFKYNPGSDYDTMVRVEKEWAETVESLIQKKIDQVAQEAEIKEQEALKVSVPDGLYRLPGKNGATRAYDTQEYYWWAKVKDGKVVGLNGLRDRNGMSENLMYGLSDYHQKVFQGEKFEDLLNEKEPALPLADGWYKTHKPKDYREEQCAAVLVLDGKIVAGDVWASDTDFNNFKSNLKSRKDLEGTFQAGFRKGFEANLVVDGKSAHQHLAEQAGFWCGRKKVETWDLPGFPDGLYLLPSDADDGKRVGRNGGREYYYARVKNGRIIGCCPFYDKCPTEDCFSNSMSYTIDYQQVWGKSVAELLGKGLTQHQGWIMLPGAWTSPNSGTVPHDAIFAAYVDGEKITSIKEFVSRGSTEANQNYIKDHLAKLAIQNDPSSVERFERYHDVKLFNVLMNRTHDGLLHHKRKTVSPLTLNRAVGTIAGHVTTTAKLPKATSIYFNVGKGDLQWQVYGFGGNCDYNRSTTQGEGQQASECKTDNALLIEVPNSQDFLDLLNKKKILNEIGFKYNISAEGLLKYVEHVLNLAPAPVEETPATPTITPTLTPTAAKVPTLKAVDVEVPTLKDATEEVEEEGEPMPDDVDLPEPGVVKKVEPQPQGDEVGFGKVAGIALITMLGLGVLKGAGKKSAAKPKQEEKKQKQEEEPEPVKG